MTIKMDNGAFADIKVVNTTIVLRNIIADYRNSSHCTGNEKKEKEGLIIGMSE